MSPSQSPSLNQQDIENEETSTQQLLGLLDKARDALEQRERELNKSNAEVGTLRRQLADVTNQARNETHRRGRDDSAAPTEDEDESQPPRKRHNARGNIRNARCSAKDAKLAALMEEAYQLGHKFAILYSPWLLTDGEPVDFFKIPLDPEYTEEKRFESDDSRVQGQLRDIRKLLQSKPHLLQHLTEDWFAEQFHLGMRRQTSNTSTRVRNHGLEKIFGKDADNMDKAETRRQYFAERIGWKEPADGKPGYYSPLNVPVLHSSGSATYKIQDVFTELLLIVIFVAILRGPEAAKRTRLSRGEVIHIPRGTYMQQKHDISFTTAGAIATCAVILRWAFSEDGDLVEKGNLTRIQYKKDHDRYLEILLEGLRKESPSILKVFRLWDKMTFGSDSSRLGGTGTDAVDLQEQDMDDARAQMDAEAAGDDE